MCSGQYSMMHEDVIFCFCVKKSLLNYLEFLIYRNPKMSMISAPKAKNWMHLIFAPQIRYNNGKFACEVQRWLQKIISLNCVM